MSSSSKSAQSSSQSTTDARVAGDNGAIGVSAQGDVQVHLVADEAFELGALAIKEVSSTLGAALEGTQKALFKTQDAARTESAQLSEMIIKLGIPAAALVFVASRYLK
jgi:phosphotransferase system IIA component